MKQFEGIVPLREATGEEAKERGDDDDREYLASFLVDMCCVLRGNDLALHLKSVLLRLPLDVLRKLKELDPAFLLGERGLLGWSTRSRCAVEQGQLMIYLSPELLSRLKEERDFVIAHELAHTYLGHEETCGQDARADAEEGEQAADRTAEAWGFPMPDSIRLKGYR